MKRFTTVSPQIQKSFQDKMEEVLNVCRQKSGQVIPTPGLKFRQMGRRAGVCHCEFLYDFTTGRRYDYKPGSGYIVINPDFLKNYWDDILNDTCPHEVAHYVAAFLFGKEAYGHGHQWRRVMAWMGIPAADRCHQYSLEGVKVRQTHRDYKYTCGCPGKAYWVTAGKHQRYQYGESNGRGARCRICRTTIVFEGFNFKGNFIPFAKRATVPVHRVEVKPTVFQFTGATVATPAVAPVVSTQPTYRLITRLVNGILTNVKVPVNA